MKQITLAQAQDALNRQNGGLTLNESTIATMLGKVSVTFAEIVYVTDVAVAAKYKGENIKKVTKANVILSSNIAAHTSVYANKVKKTARGIVGNDMAAVEAFTPQKAYFEHTSCHSIVKHCDQDKFYLYVIYNSASSMYLHNGNEVSKTDIVPYLTPSGARDMLKTDTIVHNKTAGISHKVAVRTIALNNIVSITARKQFVTI